MPVGGGYLPAPNLDDIEANAAALPIPQSERTSEAFGHFDFTQRALHFGAGLIANTFGRDPEDPMSEENPGGDAVDQRLSPDALNERYGVAGYLRFNEPRTAGDAAWMASQAHERQYRDAVFSATTPQPLTDFGAGLAGSLLDPTGLAAMFATGGLGEAAGAGFDLARGALAGARGAEAAAPVVSTLGRVANAAGVGSRYLAEGAIDNAPYVGINAFLTHQAGDDYDMGDALRDIAAGAVLHTVGHLAFRGAHALFGREDTSLEADANPAPPVGRGPFTPDPVPAEGVPGAVDTLPETARRGAFVKALDDAADDRPVDVGQYVERENNPAALSALDEGSAAPAMENFRPLEEATAVTTRGTEVPVRYGLAEAGDLVTSHDDALAVNPEYPPELQPRERDRAGAMARNYQLESELNPKLLMGDVSAAGGAPIVSPTGVVESGNGRTIALRRSAAKGGDAFTRYRAELQAQGYDTTGMKAPILVRMRTAPMDGAARASLAREMNADVTERMSVPEQAQADAKSIDDAALSHLDGTPEGARSFSRAFLQRVAGDQANTLAGPDGRLTKAGQERIDAALTAKAYGDPRLVEAIFETAEGNIKSIGAALKDAAPLWAAMRSAVARGEAPAALDITEALRGAVDLVRHARDQKLNFARYIAELLDQKEMFENLTISPQTEAVLRLMFRNEDFTRPLSSAKLAEALKDYATAARDATPGPDLFGATPDASTARDLLASLARRYAAGPDEGEFDLRPPGKSAEPAGDGEGERPEPAPPVLDVREPGGERDGGGQGLSPQGEPGSAGEGRGAGPDAGGVEAPSRGEAAIAADPVLKALQADTDARAAAAGVEAPADRKADPNTLADAVNAAAVCIIGELG